MSPFDWARARPASVSEQTALKVAEESGEYE